MQWRFPLKFGRIDRPAVTNDECDAIEPLLSLYSDGMASAAETKRVEAHLADCESCRKAHFWIRATYEVISHRPAALPPADLASRIQRAIAEADAADSGVKPIPGVTARVRFNPRPAYALAAALLVAAAVIPLARLHPGSKTVAVNVPSQSTHVGPSTLPIAPPVAIVKPSVSPAPPPVIKMAAVPHESDHTVSTHPDVDREPTHSAPRVRHETVPAPIVMAVNHPATPAAVHHTPVHEPTADRVATNKPAPSTHVENVPHESAPPAPSTPPDRVATNVPPHVDTPSEAPAPEPAPEVTHPVMVASAEHHSRGVNDYLRDAVNVVVREHPDSTVRTVTVALATGAHDDSLHIVGTDH